MALMLYIRDEKLPSMGAAVLLSPWVDMTASLGSWDENKVRIFSTNTAACRAPSDLLLCTGF